MIVLHKVIRKTLAPREGDSPRVPQFERNLLKAIFEKTKFNAFDFIIQEMWNIAISNKCSCAYAPHIHYRKIRTFHWPNQLPSARGEPDGSYSTSIGQI
jgi:hypothetical protein